MIVEIFLGLIVAGLLSLVAIPLKLPRIYALLALGVGVVILVFLLENMRLGTNAEFVYLWIPYKDLQAGFNLSSNPMVYQLVFPILAVTLLLMMFNAVATKEKLSLSLDVMLFFNLSAMILLLCSQDLIQLMVGSSAVSIVAFYVINDIGAKKKFVFYNLLGDMAIFTLLAVVYSQTNSVDLQALANFKRIGSHKDLIAILLVLSLAAKTGLFFFQNKLLDWQNLNFVRLLTITFISTPLASLIILVKLYPLINISDYGVPLLQAILIASVIWGMLGCWLMDNLKAKICYLNMIFYAFAFALLLENVENMTKIVPSIMLGQLMVILSLVMVIISASNEVYVSRMGGFIKKIKFTFGLSMLAVVAMVGIVLNFGSGELSWCYLVAMLLPLASVYQQIYFGQSRADERVSALLKNAKFFYWLPLLLVVVSAVYYTKAYENKLVAMIMLVFFAFMLLNPLRFVIRWSENELLQESDFFEKAYDILFLWPIRLMGRVLWLTVDFMFIERTIIGSISQATGLMVRGLQKVQMATWLNYLVMVALGWVIIVLMVVYKYYE